jgi:hypothetical protein
MVRPCIAKDLVTLVLDLASMYSASVLPGTMDIIARSMPLADNANVRRRDATNRRQRIRGSENRVSCRYF